MSALDALASAPAAHPAVRLFDSGIRELVPIEPGYKGCFVKGWPDHHTSRDEVGSWTTSGKGIGLRTRLFPCIDIDVGGDLGAALLRAIGVAICGTPDPLHRVGRPGRSAIPCRADDPFRKTVFVLYDEHGTLAGQVEILGDRTQYVVYGQHPSAGRPYTWHRGDVVGDVSLLAEAGPSGLPLLTAEMINDVLRATIESVAAEFNMTVKATSDARPAASAEPVDQPALLAPSLSALRDAVARIPNDLGRNDWVGFIRAIKASAGPGNEEIAREIAIAFSDSYEGPVDPSEFEHVWDSTPAPHEIGWDFIAAKARPHGFDDAAFDFAAEQPDLWVAPTEAERIACLLGDAVPAFYLELANGIRDGDVLDRWRVLRAAVDSPKRDPLEASLRSIIPFAEQCRLTDSLPRFALSLVSRASKKSSEVEWDRFSKADRSLLIRAAFAHAAPRHALLSMANVSAGTPLATTTAPRAYLVHDLIPEKAIAAFLGEPAQGKSFAALHLSGLVGRVPKTDPLTGEPVPEMFSGRPVQHGSVLYFLSEDADGVCRRRAAWEECYGRSEHLHIFGKVPALTAMDRALEFLLDAFEHVTTDGAPPPRLVVIDVLRAAIEGNENESEIVGRAMVTANVMARATGATVLLVHHSPKGRGGEWRGSSAGTAALDFSASVERANESDVILTVEKNKSGPAGLVLPFHLRAQGDAVVMHDGGLGKTAHSEESDSARWARAVGEATRRIGRSVLVSQSQIHAAARADFPHFFETPEGKKPSTYRSRFYRAFDSAVESGWVVKASKGKYKAGASPDAETSPELAGPPADLATIGL